MSKRTGGIRSVGPKDIVADVTKAHQTSDETFEISALGGRPEWIDRIADNADFDGSGVRSV